MPWGFLYPWLTICNRFERRSIQRSHISQIRTTIFVCLPSFTWNAENNYAEARRPDYDEKRVTKLTNLYLLNRKARNSVHQFSWNFNIHSLLSHALSTAIKISGGRYNQILTDQILIDILRLNRPGCLLALSIVLLMIIKIFCYIFKKHELIC